MSREPLPLRRPSEIFEFTHPPEAPIHYVATVGYFEDGRVAEIFVNGPKTGSGAAINAADAAVLVSVALQFGIPLDPLARDAAGRALGPIGALLDLLAEGADAP